MALILRPSSASSSSPFATIKPYLLPTLLNPKRTKFSIKTQQESSSAEETTSDLGASSAQKPGSSSPGLGFGSSSTTSTAAPAKKKQSKGKRERASIIRREPVEKPSFGVTPDEAAQAEELRKNEGAFLLAWLGLGGVILLEGIALAASGFLPEAWDKFFVKYVYPSFTPTVFLFVAGTVGYGVLKYLQNPNSESEN